MHDNYIYSGGRDDLELHVDIYSLGTVVSLGKLASWYIYLETLASGCASFFSIHKKPYMHVFA